MHLGQQNIAARIKKNMKDWTGRKFVFSLLIYFFYIIIISNGIVAESQQVLAPKYLCELMSKPLSARSSCQLRSADRSDLLVGHLGPVLLYPRTGHLL